MTTIEMNLKSIADGIVKLGDDMQALQINFTKVAQKVSSLDDRVQSIERTLFGANGGTQQIGVAEQLRDVKAQVDNISKVLSRLTWIVVSTIISGVLSVAITYLLQR